MDDLEMNGKKHTAVKRTRWQNSWRHVEIADGNGDGAIMNAEELRGRKDDDGWSGDIRVEFKTVESRRKRQTRMKAEKNEGA